MIDEVNFSIAEHELIYDNNNLPIDYMFISSVAQQGITELKDKLWKMLND